MTEQESRFGKALTAFLVAIGFVILANAASYFLLSDGYGVVSWNDGLMRFGFPFLVYEKGGINGRDQFHWYAALKNVSIAVAFALVASCVWHLATREQEQEA